MPAPSLLVPVKQRATGGTADSTQHKRRVTIGAAVAAVRMNLAGLMPLFSTVFCFYSAQLQQQLAAALGQSSEQLQGYSTAARQANRTIPSIRSSNPDKALWDVAEGLLLLEADKLAGRPARSTSDSTASMPGQHQSPTDDLLQLCQLWQRQCQQHLAVLGLPPQLVSKVANCLAAGLALLDSSPSSMRGRGGTAAGSASSTTHLERSAAVQLSS